MNGKLRSRSPWLAALLVTLLILGLTAILDRIEHRRFAEENRAVVLEQLSALRSHLEGALNSRLYLTRSLAAQIALRPEINRREFEWLASEMIASDPVINTIALARDGVINHVYPYEGHEAAIGLDLLAHPKRRAVVEKCIEERRGFVAGPVEMMEGGMAFISYTPVFLAPESGFTETGSPESGSGAETFWGMIDITIRHPRLLEEAGLIPGPTGLEMALRGKDGRGGSGELFWGEEAVFAAEPLTMHVTLPNGSWELAALPAGGWPTSSPLTFLLRGAGLVVAALGGILAWFMMGIPLRLREEVAKATVSLQASEGKYRELVENANSIVMKMDLKGRITFFNEFAQRFFGYREDEILGREVVGTIVPGQDTEGRDLAGMIGDLLENPANYASNENENRKRDGQRVWVSWTNRVIFAQGIPVGVLCIGNDITRLKEAEEQLRRHQQELETMVAARTEELLAANAELNRISAYKSRFLAAMSHEIRTPLHTIIGFAGLALAGGEQPPKQYLEMIKAAGDTLLGLINEILDLAGIESGRLELAEHSFNPRKFIAKILEPYAFAARQKGLDFTITIDPALPEEVVADPARLAQILLNLVGNALKFTVSGGIAVELRPGGEELSATGQLQFTVRDSGPGIPASQQERVFARFARGEGAGLSPEGHGLGLAIAEALVELMGGRIWLKSSPGKGCAFHFTMAFRSGGLEESSDEVASRPDREGGEWGELPARLRTLFSSRTLLRILVVEDNHFNRLLLVDLLQARGHQVVAVADGREAVAAYRQGNLDLILMDMMMPEMDGLEATRAIRQLEAAGEGRIPIIGVTAGARREELEKCLAAGMDCCFSKPLNINSLLTALGTAPAE